MTNMYTLIKSPVNIILTIVKSVISFLIVFIFITPFLAMVEYFADEEPVREILSDRKMMLEAYYHNEILYDLRRCME